MGQVLIATSSQLIGGRAIMGDTLAFHIMFALLGVGLPLLVSLFEFIGIVRKDDQFYETARRWSFAVGLLYVVGAASGMIVSLQLSLLWPVFMKLVGNVIGLPFFLEGFAFFIEAIFLGIYLFSWNRFNKWVHWLCSLPLVFGSLASAFFITTANSFMNSPQGFTLHPDGSITDINPIAAMFNPATPYETSHSILSYYLTTTLAVAAIYAFFLLKKKVREDIPRANYYRRIIAVLMFLALGFSLGTGFMGDEAGQYLARNEPLKLAAAESVYHTQSHASLTVLGVVSKTGVTNAIEVPNLLSIILFHDANGIVKGLDAFDPALWPPLWIHYTLDIMIGIGFFIIGVSGVFALLYLIKRQDWAYSRFILLGVVVAGIVSFVAVECGWMVTEIGRQPYIIQGILKTADAFTTAKNVVVFASLFPFLYIVLFILTYWILRHHYSKPFTMQQNFTGVLPARKSGRYGEVADEDLPDHV